MRKIKVFRKSNVKVAGRKRRFKIAFRSLLILIVLTAVFFGLRQVGMHLDSLKINQIQVSGLQAPFTPQKIIAASGLKVGLPIFGVNLSKVVQKLQENSWIDKVKISRRLPHTLLIEVTPHQPAMILSMGQFYYLGSRGEVFKELKDKTDSRDFPYLTGLSREEIEQDPPRAREVFEQALKLLSGYEVLELSKEWGLSEIHYDKTQGFSFYPEKSHIRVMVGFDDFEHKLSRLVEAYTKLKESNRSFASMDLNYEGKVILTM